MKNERKKDNDRKTTCLILKTMLIQEEVMRMGKFNEYLMGQYHPSEDKDFSKEILEVLFLDETDEVYEKVYGLYRQYHPDLPEFIKDENTSRK